MVESMAERAALDEMEPHWTNQGYTLVRDPHGEQLPPFLGKYVPDAVALGKEPQLVIEVINPHFRSAERKISQLQGLFTGHPEWKLEVVYSGSESTNLAVTSETAIDSALNQAEALARIEPRAALMLAWSGLEALGRVLHPNLSKREMSSSKLIDLLVSHGNLEQSVQSELRDLGKTRNRIAHGQLEISPSSEEIEKVVNLARSLKGLN